MFSAVLLGLNPARYKPRISKSSGVNLTLLGLIKNKFTLIQGGVENLMYYTARSVYMSIKHEAWPRLPWFDVCNMQEVLR